MRTFSLVIAAWVLPMCSQAQEIQNTECDETQQSCPNAVTRYSGL